MTIHDAGHSRGKTEFYLWKAHVLALQEFVGAVCVHVFTRISQENVGRVPCNLRSSIRGEPASALEAAQTKRRASDPLFQWSAVACGLAVALLQPGDWDARGKRQSRF